MAFQTNPHRLTREEMESIVERGGSIMHHNRVNGAIVPTLPITRKEDLPTQQELDSIDPSNTQPTIDALQRERDALDRRIQEMQGGGGVRYPFDENSESDLGDAESTDESAENGSTKKDGTPDRRYGRRAIT